MRRHAASWVVALAAGVSGGLLGSAATAQDALPAAVTAALAEVGLGADALAAVALPLGAHARWQRPWQHRAHVPMQPGSTMKLVTSIVTLDRLGPGHRGSTELRSAAPLRDGVLQGDLVLVGGADPDLGVAQLWALLLDLRQAGVTTIAGDVIVDRSLFRPARSDLGPPPFDDTPELAYNVIPDALHLAGSLLPLELKSSVTGVTASTVPPLPGIELTSRMVLTDTPCNDWHDDWRPALVQQSEGRTLIELQGGFPRGCTQRTELQLIDRLELTERLLRTLWQGLGGRWDGSAREAPLPSTSSLQGVPTRLLARRLARPWGEVLRGMNKLSDNAATRLLYLNLGVRGMATDTQTTTAELAAREVRGWLVEHAIEDRGLVLDNGSGLSRSERITPWQLASMLKVAHAGRHAADLAMSLPVAGTDGTLRNRLKNSPAAGWARLKTGSLRNVVALAGYVNDAEGRPWAVAMMVNHAEAARARPVLDALVDQLARSGPHGAAPVGVGPLGDGP